MLLGIPLATTRMRRDDSETKGAGLSKGYNNTIEKGREHAYIHYSCGRTDSIAEKARHVRGHCPP